MRLAAPIALLAALVAASAALAAPPTEVTHEVVDRTRTLTDFCAYPVELHSEGIFTTWVYLDEAGELDRARFHVERSFTVTFTNPANGKSISSVLGGPVFIDFHPDGSQTQIVAGRERLFIARGEGPVAKQVGRIVFEIAADGTETVPFVAGQWDLDITPELCAYLA
jgi:hypothetical protein